MHAYWELGVVTAKHYQEAKHKSLATLHFIGFDFSERGVLGLNTMMPAGLNDDFSLKCFLRTSLYKNTEYLQ